MSKCESIEIKKRDSPFGTHEGRYECQLDAEHDGEHRGQLMAARHVDDWQPVHRDAYFNWGL